MGKQITAALLRKEGHMHTQVNRSQFEIKDTTVVHTPTGAEFIPLAGDSVMVWTGDIGQRLPSGDIYRYADVLDMMRTVWREGCSHDLTPMSAA
jgi:hypothetical protein